MAFQKVGGSRKYFKYSECTPGQKLIENGLYVGAEEGKYGVQHIFNLPSKETAVLNSAGKLNYQLENFATPGKTRCNVTYAGKSKITKGAMAGKDFHDFDTEVDDGDGVLAAGTPPAEPSAVRADSDDISL